MRKALIAGIALAGILAPAIAAGQEAEPVTTFTTDAPFEDVAADLQDAIVNRGYVVDYRGLIGDMLKRTAGDVGGTTELYANAEFFQFCSAVVSREAMEADLGNIAYCPYVLFAYEPAGEPGSITVGFRRLPEGDGRDAVNALLEEIAAEAAGQ